MSKWLENRRKWIEFQKDPKRIKHTGELESMGNPEARCCLGNACAALGLEKTTTYSSMYRRRMVEYGGEAEFAPDEVVGALGLYHNSGTIPDGVMYVDSEGNIFQNEVVDTISCDSLVSANDETSATHYQIGAYLESVIEGGPNTPFRPLSTETTFMEGRKQ